MRNPRLRAVSAPTWALAGQLGLLTGILLSTLLLPKFVMSGGGISNYGVHSQTISLYSAGFIMAASGAVISSRILRDNSHYNAKFVSKSLIALAVLYALVLLSTYSYQLSNLLNFIHQAVSTVLYVYMTGLGVYLTFNSPRTFINRSLRYGLYTATAIAVLTYAGVINLLFIGETMTGLLFGIILIRYLRLIDK